MRETSLIGTVLAVLRDDPGPHAVVRVHLDEMPAPAEELVVLLRAHLAAAQPPVDVGDLQVVPLPPVPASEPRPARIHVELVPPATAG